MMEIQKHICPCLGATTTQEALERAREDRTSLVTAIRLFYDTNFGPSSKLILGISGGIDSAVVAVLAREALGPDRLHFLVLPAPFSTEVTQSDALLFGTNLGVKTQAASIDASFWSIQRSFKNNLHIDLSPLALENLQARLRMCYLMSLSNTIGGYVINTDNKSEAAMGFCTLYGDSIGVFAPLGDLYKTRVYALAHAINEDRELIPQCIIERAPSAELSFGQKDTDTLPPYDLLDELLYAHIECGEDEATLKMHFDTELVDRVLGTLHAMAFKRAVGAPAPRRTPVTLLDYDARA